MMDAETNCPSCNAPGARVLRITAPVKWGHWPPVDVERDILRCDACGEDFSNPGDSDAATFKALQILLRDHAIPRASPQVDGSEERVESGPVRIGSDWAGTFIRGDDGLAYALALEHVLSLVPDTGDVMDSLNVHEVRDLIGKLRACHEPCDAVSLLRAHTERRTA